MERTNCQLIRSSSGLALTLRRGASPSSSSQLRPIFSFPAFPFAAFSLFARPLAALAFALALAVLALACETLPPREEAIEALRSSSANCRIQTYPTR